MKRKLPLKQFHVPVPETWPIRVTRCIRLGPDASVERLERKPIREQELGGGVRQLIVTRTFARSMTLVGTLTTIGLFALVLALLSSANTTLVQRDLRVAIYTPGL